MQTILIVDNDPDRLRMLASAVAQNLQYRVVTAGDATSAIECLRSGHGPKPDLLLVDLVPSSPGAIELIRALRNYGPDLPIVLVTPFGERRHAIVQSLDAGATDFVTRPMELVRLRHSLAIALLLQRLTARTDQFGKTIPAPAGYSRTVGEIEGNGSPFLSMLDQQGRIKNLQTVEDEAIRFALQHAGGSISGAARQLGIGRSTLYRRVNARRGNNRNSSEMPMPVTAAYADEHELAD